jgi:hypothetical protein
VPQTFIRFVTATLKHFPRQISSLAIFAPFEIVTAVALDVTTVHDVMQYSLLEK